MGFVARGEAVDQVGELGAFRMLPGFDDGRDPVIAALAGPVQQGHAGVGDGQQGGTPVVGIGATLHQSHSDQCSSLPAHCGRVGVHRGGEPGNPRRSPAGQRVKQHERRPIKVIAAHHGGALNEPDQPG